MNLSFLLLYCLYINAVEYGYGENIAVNVTFFVIFSKILA